MAINTRVKKLEETIKPAREPFLVVLRQVDSPPIPQEKIDAAIKKAKEEGLDVVIVEGGD